MSKSSKSDGHADGACPAPPGSGRRLSHSGTVQESFRGGVLLIAVLMLAGLTAVPPAAQAQQQDTLDRARQQRMEQRRQQREAERRERMKERQKEIQARIQRNAAAPAGAVNEQDSLALVALYDSTDGDNWDNNDGWLEAPVSEWHGVTVSGDRVVSLYLAGLYGDPFGLSGSLPPEMGDLTALQNLNLRHNQLTGEIPPELSQLSSLEGLFFRYNQLTGQIPSELSQLSNLEVLWLDKNQLTGQIPPELSQLSSLEDLFLNDNQLTGQIPPELSQLSSLERLSLNNNQLTGAIPVSFTNLTSMSNSDDGTFYFNDTDLCEPPDEEFQTWLSSVENVLSTGETCSGDSPSVAKTFSYPVGSKVNVPERITPETNNLYPDNPEADPERESSDVGPYWRNAQDVGSYYSALGGLHAGEDWNWGSGTSDRGRAVYATANGQVLENDRIVSDGGPGAGGYAIIIEHEVPSGETYYSLYLHVVDLSSTDGEIEPPSVSGTVERGEVIARVGDVEAFSSHLDFQIRDTNWDPSGPLYPNANPNGYYSHDGGVYTDGLTAPQVDDAFSLMEQDGILDASDFIDSRSEAPSGLTATSGDGEVTLSWNALPESDLDGYNVYRATTSFSETGDDKKITDSPVGTPSYADGTVDGGTTYYYRVTAVGPDGTESGPSGQANAALQSLQLLGLEVNQSVQTWENTIMPLVEGKKTIVRAHLQNKGEGSTPVNVKLKGTRNGSSLPDSPKSAFNADNFEARPSPPSEDSVETIRKRRADISESLNFELPGEWLKGTVTLKLVGDGVDCDKTPALNANCELEIVFERIDPPKITFFEIHWTGLDFVTRKPNYNIDNIKERITSMYPIENANFSDGGTLTIN